MPFYRKRPVVIEAIQFKAHLPLPFVNEGVCLFDGVEWFIKTLEGPLRFKDGDYIIRGTHGEFYPVKKEIFETNYEEVQ